MGAETNMVDCSSRCAQDRRVLKKELLTWTKKVPILLGLELIAERYAGKKVFHNLMEPFNELESGEPEDWDPTSPCFYCHNDKNSHSPISTEGSTDQEQFPAESEAYDYYQQFLPLGYPGSLPLEDSTDKPLDLSASSRNRSHGNNDHDDPSQPLVELKVPQITNKTSKKREIGGKRSYTEEDLNAAMSDIRSGKLGTRRAATLYGIPRSTLRNKMFRLENENAAAEQSNNVGSVSYNGGPLSMADLLQNMAGSGELLAKADWAAELGQADWSAEDFEQRLDLLRRKHDLNAGLERPFGMPPLFFSNRHLMECEKAFSLSSPFDYEVKLPFLQELIRKFAQHRMEAERVQCLGGFPFLHDLHQGAAASTALPGGGGPVELKIPSYKPMRSYTNGSSSSAQTTSYADHLSPSENVLPYDSSDITGVQGNSHTINETLKDIIAKTITEKVRSRSQLEPDFSAQSMAASSHLSMNGFSLKHASSTSSDPGFSPAKRIKQEHKTSDALSPQQHPGYYTPEKSSEDGDSKLQKKTRPKRGQYRKYNSQLLLEAVRAVQRGEMSVHRAGSYFGVPHSTLEYKVKERHLLRTKKPRETRNKKLSNTADGAGPTLPSTDTSGSTSTDTNADPVDLSESHKSPPESPSTESELNSQTNTKPVTTKAGKSSSKTSQSSSMPSSVAETDLLNHSVSSLLSAGAAAAAAASMGLPGAPPLASFYNMGSAMPLGFGWPPLPLPMPDPAMAAYLPGYAGINLSASDLLKKLQMKVQAGSEEAKPSPSTAPSDSAQSIQGSKGGSSQVTVK